MIEADIGKKLTRDWPPYWDIIPIDLVIDWLRIIIITIKAYFLVYMTRHLLIIIF